MKLIRELKMYACQASNPIDSSIPAIRLLTNAIHPYVFLVE